MLSIEIGNMDHIRGLSDDDFKTLRSQVTIDNTRRRRRVTSPKRGSKGRDGRVTYVSWDEAKEILGRYYTRKPTTSAAHASFLWSALHQAVRCGLLELEAYCRLCDYVPRKDSFGEEDGRHAIGCPSRADSAAKTLLYSRRSLIAGFSNLNDVPESFMRSYVREDFELVVRELAQR